MAIQTDLSEQEIGLTKNEKFDSRLFLYYRRIDRLDRRRLFM